MRILHISTRLILGGSQENTILSCEGQARLGHEVHLAFGPIYGPEGSMRERVERFNREAEAANPGKANIIHLHEVHHLVREVAPRTDWKAMKELKALIEHVKPDIVHTHSSKAGILGRMAAWDAKRPEAKLNGSVANPEAVYSMLMQGGRVRVIHTIHGPPFMPEDGSSLRKTRVRLNNFLYTVAERHAAKKCHQIISVADAMTKQYLARNIGKPEQYVTVRSGMEVDPYLTPRPGESREEVRKELGLSEGDYVIGTVARLAEHKGHDDLLDSLAKDLRKHPHWKLLWVGDGWWRKRLISKARKMGLGVDERDAQTRGRNGGGKDKFAALIDPQIIITGLVPPERVPAMIRAMDVLAHPSYREGLPRTVPQALLCGVCPVAYDVDGTGEVCREMQTGRLVPRGGAANMREAIKWAYENPEQRAALARRGQEECEVAFSALTMVQELENVYAMALAKVK